MHDLRPSSALAVCAAFLLAGCLQGKDEATLDAKGAGSITQTFEIDAETAKQLLTIGRAMASGNLGGGEPAGGGSAADDLFVDVFSIGATKGLAKDVAGFTLREVEDRLVAGRRTVKVAADFTSLEAVAKAGRFLTNVVELSKAADGSYALAFENLGFATFAEAMKTGPAGSAAIPGLPDGTDPNAVAGMLEPYLGRLSMKRTVALPGTVLETNGTKGPDGKSVTWTAGYSDLMGKGIAHKVTFKGDGVALTPFRAVPDLNDLLRRAREGARLQAEADKAAAAKAPAPVLPPPPPSAPAPAMGG